MYVSRISPPKLLEKAASKREALAEVNGIVVPKGVVVISNVPSEALLNMYFKEIFRHEEIGTKAIKLVRGYFVNKLKYLRGRFYDLLQRHGLKMAPGLYVIPATEVDTFNAGVEDIRERYRRLKRELEDFVIHGRISPELERRMRRRKINIDRNYVELIKNYIMETHGVDKEEAERMLAARLSNIDFEARFQVLLIPITFTTEMFEHLLDEESKRLLEKHMEAMAREVQRDIEARLAAIAERLERRLVEVVKIHVNPKMVEPVERDLAELERLAAEYNIRLPQVEKMKEAIRLYKERRFDELEATYLREVADVRMKKLLEQLKREQEKIEGVRRRLKKKN